MNRYSKTALWVGLVSSVSLSSLVSVAHASATQHITLTMWQQWGGGHEEAALNALIKTYERTHPNVTIKEVPVYDNTKILTAISGGNPPDIIDLGSSSVIGEWAAKGALVDLAPYIKADKTLSIGNFVPAGWKAVTYNGGIYGLPFANFDIALLYNKKLFRQAGLSYPPRTLEQLTQDAFKLTKVKNGKIAQMGFVPNYPGGTLDDYGWLFGGDWYDAKTHQATANLSGNVAALNWEKQFYTKFGAQRVQNWVKSAGAYLTVQDPFESGKLAMTYDGFWVYAYIKDNNRSLLKDIGVAPFPGPHGLRSGTTFVDTDPQVIPTGANNVAQAWDFIQWEATNAKATANFLNQVPGLPQIYHTPEMGLSSDPLFKVFIKESESANAHVWPQTPVSSEYQTLLSQAEEQVLLGQKTSQQALTDVNQKVNQDLAH